MADEQKRPDVRNISGTVNGQPARLSREYRVFVRTTGHRFGTEKDVGSAKWDEVTFRSGVIGVGQVQFVADDLEEAKAWIDSLHAVIAVAVRSASATQGAMPTAFTGAMPTAFTTPLDGAVRWQYAVVNTGSFNSVARLTSALHHAGKAGWELVTVYDKSSNWFNGFEKGLMLMKRAVPEGVEVTQHCIVVQQAGQL